jgi:hypothetical protein
MMPTGAGSLAYRSSDVYLSEALVQAREVHAINLLVGPVAALQAVHHPRDEVHQAVPVLHRSHKARDGDQNTSTNIGDAPHPPPIRTASSALL